MRETPAPLTNLMPIEVAKQLLDRNNGNHRAAEVEAWKLRAAHGPETENGRLLARAAFDVADLYHNVPWIS